MVNENLGALFRVKSGDGIAISNLNPWSLIIISCCNHFVYAVCRYV